ncbi:MAG: butyrate kinase [Ignavibacteriae bacterium]|nr:butyrate kinase [Ignavibacteriota bacterium]
MSSMHSVLIINPGSTSTKVAIAENERLVKCETFRHSTEQLQPFSHVWEQFRFRLETCKKWTAEHVHMCSAVVAIGGLLRPLHGGVYRVNQKMLEDARSNFQGEHASNLGCALAFEIATSYNIPAFVVDPVSVDEFEPLAYYSGHACIKRRSLSHALNIHAAARRASEQLNIPLSQSSFVIAHLGGGISIAPVRKGKIIDVNDASSDGPFSPERTGGLPLQPFISLLYSQQFSEAEVRQLVMGKGGLVSYLGTNSVVEAVQRARAGDATAIEALQAMAYQIAKEIGAMATVLNGNVNAIVLTGGIATSELVTVWIEERVKFVAPVIILPGEDEMQALALGVLRALRGEEKILEY